jgi:hypothetical protein
MAALMKVNFTERSVRIVKDYMYLSDENPGGSNEEIQLVYPVDPYIVTCMCIIIPEKMRLHMCVLTRIEWAPKTGHGRKVCDRRAMA